MSDGFIGCFYYLMSFWKSKSLNGGSISRIITECEELQQSLSRNYLPKLTRSATLDESAGNTQAYFKVTAVQKRQLPTNRLLPMFPCSPAGKNRRRVNKDQYGGEISLNTVSKGAFSKMVVKFKKSMQPTNASKGQNSTSNHLANLPARRPQLFDEREEAATQGELKRLHILSRVIKENTRREIKLWRERSASKYHL